MILNENPTVSIKLENSQLDENLNFNESHKNKDKGAETVYVERRYCTVCNIEQPIRAKHCKQCNRCCASYDHHCPWMGTQKKKVIFNKDFDLGTCIGEKNHLLFCWYLVFQFIEVVFADIYLITDIVYHQDDNFFKGNIGRVLIACAATFFVFMVGCLLVYHSYLASLNLTTCKKKNNFILNLIYLRGKLKLA